MVNIFVLVTPVLTAIAASTTSVKASFLPTAREASAICPQAARFGTVIGLPASVTTGQSVTLTHDYTCSFSFGIPPEFTDYLLEVTANGNGFQAPILVARRNLEITPTQPMDTFTFTVPFAFFFAPASYALTTVSTFSVNGTNGSPVFEQGGIINPVQIIDAESSA